MLALVALATPAFAQTSADLEIGKLGPDELTGGPATYTITPRNNGPDASTNATVTDTLPAGMTFASLTAPAGWSCTTPAVGAGGTVSCTKPTLAAGETAVLTLVVNITTAIQGNTYTNTASIDSTAPGETDPVPGNDAASTTLEIVDSGSGDLQLVKSHAGGVVFPGGTVVFTLGVSNVGITPIPGRSRSSTRFLPALRRPR